MFTTSETVERLITALDEFDEFHDDEQEFDDDDEFDDDEFDDDIIRLLECSIQVKSNVVIEIARSRRR